MDSGHGAVEASRRNVEFGTGTEFDLLNAQNNYYSAVRAYSQSRYDYLTSVLTLKQQAGRLSELDLLAVDGLLIERGVMSVPLLPEGLAMYPNPGDQNRAFDVASWWKRCWFLAVVFAVVVGALGVVFTSALVAYSQQHCHFLAQAQTQTQTQTPDPGAGPGPGGRRRRRRRHSPSAVHDMRLLPKEPVMLRDTAGQDRVIERQSLWRRHPKMILAALGAVAAVVFLGAYLLRYSGAGLSIDRSRVSIATVERGSFVRDIAADGQVVAAVSPTLYANALGTVTLKVHAGDTVSKGTGVGGGRQPRSDGQTVPGGSNVGGAAHRLAARHSGRRAQALAAA